MSVIIGIDPGSRSNLGMAWCSHKGTNSETMIMGERGLPRLREAILRILRDNGLMEGSMVIYETPFFMAARPQIAGPLFKICGVIEEVSESVNVPIIGISPAQLKKLSGIKNRIPTPCGELTKAQKRALSKARNKDAKDQMVSAMRSIGHNPANEHEADALALVEYALSKKSLDARRD